MSKKNPITVSSWTLGDQCKFEDRVIAAKEAGYEGIGLRAETYVDALNEGLHDEDILAILDKHDMKVTEVEYIVQWCEEHRSYEQKYKEQMCFHMCELFGVGHINCGLMENYSVEYTAQKLKEVLEKQIQDSGLNGVVKIFPFKKNILQEAKNYRMFILSSDYEGLSNSMIEAVSMGIPSICTDCPIGGAKMVIKNGINGFLVPVGDCDAMANAMETASDITCYLEISKNAKKTAEIFSEKRILNEWIRII